MSKPKCYCGQELRPDGTCVYRCPPEARPAHLRAQASKRLANSRRERLTGRGSFPSADAELRQLREARDAAVKAREDAEAQLAKVRHDRDEMIRVHDEVEADRDQLRAENARLSQREPTSDEMERALAGREEAFLGGTIRRCRVCRCAVFGGPTACIRCVEREDRDKYKALLSRAVAALQDMADLQWNSRHPNCDQRKVDNARAILALVQRTVKLNQQEATQREAGR
jgi:hypothetical protein